MGNRLTSKLSLLFLSFVVVLLVFPAMAFGETITPDGTTSTSTPTIQSDQADYPPGATVTLTGSNWQPGESVNISVNDDAGKTWDRNVDVTADDSGAIRDEFQLPDWFVAQYSVKATGVQSGETTTSFTDGNIRVKLTGGPTSASFQVRGVYGNMTCASPPQPSQTSVTVTNSPTTVASADGTQSVQITAPNIAGYTFSGWSGGASGQTVCVTGSSGTTNIDANYTSAPTITNTTLSAASATGTYGGTTNLSATLTANSSGISGKIVTFTLNGTSVGSATTNTSGVATLSNVSLSGINASTYATGVGASFAGDSTYASSSGSNSLTVDKKSVTGSFTAANKTYDGTTAATISGRSLSGKVGTDDVSLSGGTTTFADKNVGNGKTVTGSGFSLSGAAKDNYTLGSVSNTTANITPKTVTGSFTAKDKVYDGTRSAEVLNKSLASGDVIGSDAVTLDVTNAQFGDKNVGNGKTVSANLALSGGQAGNYILNSTTANTTANITAKSITGSFTAANKVYDGNTDAAASNRSLTGAIGTDTVSLIGGTAAFNDKNIGSNKPVTLSGATLSGDDATNYSLSSVDNAHADITKRPITVSAVAKSKVYGEEDPPLNYEVTSGSLVGGESFTGSLTRDAGENVGSYPIRQGSLSAGTNYNLTFNGANLTIEQATANLSLNQDDLDQNYNGQPKQVGFSISLQSLSNDVSVTYDGSQDNPTEAGSYHVVASLSNQNYQAQDATGTLVIHKATPEITWSNPAAIEYGTLLSNAQLNATASGVNGGNLQGNFVYSPPSGTKLDAGNGQDLSVDFTPDDSTNYNGTSKTVQINVNKAGQTIDFGALSSKTYGDPDFTVAATASSNLSVSFESTGQCSVSGSTVHITEAGNCTITASQAGNDNYNAAPNVEQSFHIDQATAQVSLSNLEQVYNGSARAASASTTPDGLNVSFAYSQDGSPVANPTNAGSYHVVATVNDDNYKGSAEGTLVISKAQATINLGNLDHIYDGGPKGASVASSTPGGLGAGVSFEYYNKNADGSRGTKLDGPPVNAGSYIAVATLTNPNYEGSAEDTLTINKAHAEIILSGLVHAYDGAAKSASVDISPEPAKNSATRNDLSVKYYIDQQHTDLVANPTNAGSYYVVASLNNRNYMADSVTRTLVIDKASLTVTADDKTRAYGQPNPDFTASFSGFVNGENKGVLSGSLGFDTDATASSPVGAYDIVPKGLSADNYEITFQKGTLRIAKAIATSNVTVTPNSPQYSDKVDLVATLSSDSVADDAPAAGVSFKIGTRTVGTANLTPDNNGNLRATLSGVALTEAPGSYIVTAEYSGVSPNFTVNNATAPLTVARENATTGFSGPLFYAVPSGNATVTLSTVITDAADGSRGDVTKANVTFVNRDTGATLCTPTEVVPLTPGDTTVGAATCNVSLPFGTSGSTQYTVGTKVNGYYVDDNSTENTVVTVSQAVNGMITGGGYLLNASPSSSGGRYAADAGQKTNFGFNVKYNKSLTNLQGTINTIVRSGGRVYQIKGNAMSSLTTKPCPSGSPTATCPATATFNGKANIQDITNPLAPVSVVGNASLQVTMTDKGEPGKADTIGIQLTNTNGSLLFSSKWVSPRTAEDLLAGGNLVVR